MSQKVILLVEDNKDDELLAIRALKTNNNTHEIVIARDGRQALDYLLDETRPLPALVLLDWKLPKVSGHEVLKTVRATPRTALVPVVILTTSNEVQDVSAGYHAGCNSYLRKAVDFVQFADAMRQIQDYWLNLNEAPPQDEAK